MSIDAPNNSNVDTNLRTQKPPANTEARAQTDTPKVASTLESINVKVGQAIQAKVVAVLEATSNKAGQNQFEITLAIDGKLLSVKSNIQLQPGQLIEVRVNEKGELILPRPETKDISQLIKAISRVLPFQQPIGKVVAQLLHNLPLLAQQNTQLTALVEQLIATLPKASDFKAPGASIPLTASQLTQTSPAISDIQTSSFEKIKLAMEKSGIFMESRFAAAAKSPPPLQTGTQTTPQPTTTSSLLSTHAETKIQVSSVTSTSTVPSSVSMSPSSAVPPDLKSTFSQSLDTLNSIHQSSTGIKSTFTPQSDLNLLKNPFDFPVVLLAKMSSRNSKEQNLSTGDLLKNLAGALNRIQFNQLNSLYQSQSNSSDTTAIQTWQMEIPFINSQKDIDPIQIRIDQEDTSNNEADDSEKKSKWKLTLAFDFDNLGPMVVQVNLMPPSISSTIWASDKETLNLINNETKVLRDSLSKIGLTVDDITCMHGQPNIKKTRLSQQIVDTKA